MLTLGLLGSGHCLGMCGGFALTIGASRPAFWPVLGRQVLYSAGRLFTYGFLGALAGTIGARLSQLQLPLFSIQHVLSIAAGVAMVLIGLSSLGVFRRLRRRPVTTETAAAPQGAGFLTGLLAHFLNARGVTAFLLAGVFTGFLPCGLVAAALAKTLAIGNPIEGWVAMVLFGLGTVPAMVALGCGSLLLSRPLRAGIVQVAACFVVLLGVATVVRGWGPVDQACPHCGP